ncbi:hypothetical protein M0R45_012640 [Rubus argutus]|uniref:3-hydroxyisobutyryl-CoA hydrolase n=1 Tax=Rubus argutus TaxID=59490 RepID=A0AAW1YES5_RUBAR
MQRAKAFEGLKRCVSRRGHHRAFSSQPNYARYHDDHVQDLVMVEGRTKSRAAILNRPSALNALNTAMVSRLKRLYESWEDNPDIGFVLMKGSGRAFCSGADAVSIYQLLNQGNVEECRKFFETLYKFVYIQGTYLKPHVAILDGITMGGGAGISLPGMFRVGLIKLEASSNPLIKSEVQVCVTSYCCATFLQVFANPEAQMGFHPDAGASYYLSRLPGYLGEYLALTGDKLNGVEMIACGLLHIYSLNARLAMVEERVDRRSILSKLEGVDRCFSHDTIEEIIDALEKEAADSYDEWCTTALKKLKEASPLSLKVSLRSIREGRFESLHHCLAREYRISLNGISKQVSSDFCEGVRARLVEKDFAPKWDPPSLKEVSKDMVDCYFSPLPEFEPELELPTASREPFM